MRANIWIWETFFFWYKKNINFDIWVVAVLFLPVRLLRGSQGCSITYLFIYLSIYVTDVLDFVWGNVDVALKLFPNVLNFLIASIEKKK